MTPEERAKRAKHFCQSCGKKFDAGEMTFARNPFAEEVYDDTDDTSNPERWWCHACYQEMADDI